MKLQVHNDFNTRGLPHPISYNPNQMIVKKSMEKEDSLKVDIKTHPR